MGVTNLRHAPLVSCLMPTRNRRRFVRQAITYFLHQDYARRELIVLDDGEDPVADLVPPDERIRYRRIERRMSVGAKRNLGCELARGELVAHFEDDDWSSPQRLSRQVAAIAAGGRAACALDGVIHYRPLAGDAWCVQAGAGGSVVAGTLIYRARAWRAAPFADVDAGEEGPLLAELGPDGLELLPGRDLYVALVHPGNARALQHDLHRDPPAGLGEVAALFGPDVPFYVGLRSPAAATPRTVPELPITLTAPFMVFDGYGSMAEYLALGLARAGADVHLAPLRLEPAGLTPELLALAAHSRPSAGRALLHFAPGPPSVPESDRRELFVNTMWETDRLPDGWAARLNRARAVIVPSRFVARTLRAGGVEVPVEVVPQGVDPAVYHYRARAPRESLTTLMVGPICARKNTLLGIAAWQRAFARDRGARLILKARWLLHNYRTDDPRITVVDSNETSHGIAHWYEQADVLLALGNEGFGLPLVEAMATGLPVVALDSEGQADVCAEAADLVLSVPAASYQPLPEAPFEGWGVRGVPAVERVAARLRWVDRHREEAAELGRKASEWAIRHRNVWRMGPAVLNVLERHTRSDVRLQRRRTLWVAPGAPEEVAAYAGQLCDAAVGAELWTRRPELATSRLLHIQQGARAGGWELADAIQRARGLRLPVLLTEHRVLASPVAGEEEADIIVALSDADARLLRRRWPDRRVELIPHGCPAWSRARPGRRGRRPVIAAWGRLDRPAAWRLLEVARSRHARLRLAAPACSAEVESAWRQASAGTAARRLRLAAPTSAWVRQVAQDADVFVHLGAAGGGPQLRYLSAALACGAPVVTPRLSGLAELRDVTVQAKDPVLGTCQVLDDPRLRDQLWVAARDYCQDHSWDRVAERHLALWRTAEST